MRTQRTYIYIYIGIPDTQFMNYDVSFIKPKARSNIVLERHSLHHRSASRTHVPQYTKPAELS